MSSSTDPIGDEPLVTWLEGMATARGHGGKKEIAERLDIAPDVLSQLFRRRSGFDRKTRNLIFWMISSKAEDYADCPVLKAVQVDQLVFELRQMDEETQDWTWRRAE